MSSCVRSVLCSRTFLRSKQLSVVPTRQICASFDLVHSNVSNYYNNKSDLKLLSSKKALNVGRSKYTTALSNMTKDQANELVFRLNDSERQILLQVLNQFESNKERKRLEGELAASRWRSRFGRPAKMRVLGDVDPTGSYCPVPEDWLKKHLVDSTPPPTTNELIKLVAINSLPFIGFGFLDNFTMIIAGDYIEHSIGCVITISTMAAAALGNTISDVLGIGSAYYVERLAEKVGIRPPELTPIQLEMNSCRKASNIGRVLGITIGCLLGMCPLLFISGDEKKEKPTDVTISASPDEEAARGLEEKT